MNFDTRAGTTKDKGWAGEVIQRNRKGDWRGKEEEQELRHSLEREGRASKGREATDSCIGIFNPQSTRCS